MALKTKFQYQEDFQHSSQPITTGTSILGLQFDQGVVIAADQLVSYGSMARFRDIQRVHRVNNRTILGCGGDYADYQYVLRMIEQKSIDESAYEDQYEISPSSLHCWLTRVQYNRRSKFDPLWCSWVVGGLDDNNKPFLGLADRLGTAYVSPHISSGFGNYLAIPLLREEYEKRDGKLTETEAIDILKNCLEVLYYRDARSWNKYNLAIVNQQGSKIEGPFEFRGKWNLAHEVSGYE
ncbi:macroglobulin complement-related 1 [Sarcoptes scabiei]|uniref:Proteasome subunit beta n=1 Tax=Sarcoptes scabiei TaxID=52283 RepID=A0A131ZUQ4_SARSC|nr:proteasome subunit beta type-4-like protein [Sarcoptes scabiei]UXI19308.1 macroglobulin complement-related 1 [Sarcoptes scabiei]